MKAEIAIALLTAVIVGFFSYFSPAEGEESSIGFSLFFAVIIASFVYAFAHLGYAAFGVKKSDEPRIPIDINWILFEKLCDFFGPKVISSLLIAGLWKMIFTSSLGESSFGEVFWVFLGMYIVDDLYKMWKDRKE